RGASPRAALPSEAGSVAALLALSVRFAEWAPSAGPALLLQLPLPLPPTLPDPRQAKRDPGGRNHLHEACPTASGMPHEAGLQVVRRAEGVSGVAVAVVEMQEIHHRAVSCAALLLMCCCALFR